MYVCRLGYLRVTTDTYRAVYFLYDISSNVGCGGLESYCSVWVT
jgi:hypothetical protein